MTDPLDVEYTSKRPKLDDSQTQTQSQEDEHIMCAICCDAWTTGGQHCLVSLKCGHLFGKNCITRWINERTQKVGAKKTGCPNCSKNARVGDIRIVLPIKLAVKDTSEVDKMKRELESKKRAIVEYEINIDKMLLAINMRRGQIEKAKKQVEEGCY